MRFKDRNDAGLQLLQKLAWLKGKDVIILAIPRGGIVVGDVIAKSLNVKLDVIVPRKLGAPSNPELAIGAVMHDGSTYLNDYVVKALNVNQQYIKKEIEEQVSEIERRLHIFRGSKTYVLRDKIIVLVDDGIATGATTMVAVTWIKKQKPKMIVLATPVAPGEMVSMLKQMVDELIVLMMPLEFGAVGEFYEDFSQVEDENVLEILHKYK
ncbi:MAG TPA: phosphoribosyltransferase family protein [Nitrososphaerales archaeon]|nr:phosphoribosyltransferase family protein [Nitrososphaerales archaeon]